jgi:hypothetical protein
MTELSAWKRTPEQLGMTPQEFVAALAKQREQARLESESPRSRSDCAAGWRGTERRHAKRRPDALQPRHQARTMAADDPSLRREAGEALLEWNDRNRELRIRIKDSQVPSLVQEMPRTSRLRLIGTDPQETRMALVDSLGLHKHC